MELPDPPLSVPSTNEFGSSVKAAQNIDEEIGNYRDKIRALKTRRNELVLISRLPPELLSTIFQLVQEKPLTYFPERTKWTAISHVCGHWRRVALQSPSLWSNIDIHGHESGPGTWVEVFLERSKQAALTLSAKLTYRSLQPIKAALEKVDRMRHLSLTLQTPMAQDLLDILENHPAPLLEHFQINCSTSEGSGRLPDRLFSGNYSSLRVLKLVNCDSSWNLPPLHNLVILQIHNSNIFAGSGESPTILQLISILENSPNIKQIDLEGMLPGSQPGAHTGSPIILPNLSTISLKSPIVSSVELLNHISYPASSSVSVDSLDNTRHNLTDICRITCLTFNPENIIGLRPPVHYLKVTSPRVGGGLLKVEAWCRPGNNPEELSETPMFSLGVHMLSGTDPLIGAGDSTFWNLLALEELKCLGAVGLDLGKHAWLNLSTHLGHLTTLKLYTLSDKAASNVLDALSSKRPGNLKKDKKRRQKTSHLYFPALHGLSIIGWDFETPPENLKQTSKLLKHLITCLKTRKRLGAGIETLDLTRCRYLFGSGVEELKKVVANVTWDMSEEVTESEDDDDDDEYYGYDWDVDYGDYDSDEDLYFY
ncbi:hypothetical protein BDZ94DRAFT_1296135 [Collybia nuda]|uniref:F-box domain-containing protein n=1 Tax=Collybia nuda TaxID=64659 RepID=A0A9P5Y9P5_9AGAR|nr:hypothetical protein BDZ94DRAFT_1296135 [Collybia nuda]